MRVKPPDFAFFRRRTQQSRAVYPLQCFLQLATGSPSQSGTLPLFTKNVGQTTVLLLRDVADTLTPGQLTCPPDTLETLEILPLYLSITNVSLPFIKCR